MTSIQRQNFVQQNQGKNVDLNKLKNDADSKAQLEQAGISEAKLRAADVNQDGVVSASEAWKVADDFDHDGNAQTLVAMDRAGQSTSAGNAVNTLGLLLQKKDLQGVEKVGVDGAGATRDVKGIFYNDRFGKDIALTFDDGPNPVNTPKVLDILKRNGIKATFYVQGQNVARNPELIKRMVAEGHTLGNHTYDHANLSKASAAEVRSQLDRTQAAVDQALGYHYPLKTMRPPYGATNAAAKGVFAERNQPMILWQVDTLDWKNKNNDQAIKDNIFKGEAPVQARGGAILFHDIHPQTNRVLEETINKLKEDGYQFNTVEQLIEKKYGDDVFEGVG